MPEKRISHDGVISSMSEDRVTVKIKIASPNDAASPMSRIKDGTGRIIIKITVINASANRIVGWNRAFADIMLAHPE